MLAHTKIRPSNTTGPSSLYRKFVREFSSVDQRWRARFIDERRVICFGSKNNSNYDSNSNTDNVRVSIPQQFSRCFWSFRESLENTSTNFLNPFPNDKKFGLFESERVCGRQIHI